MAEQLVEVELPDGELIWARVQAGEGPEDVGLGDVLRLRGLRSVLRGVVTQVVDATTEYGPDELSVEFNVELASVDGSVVAALVGVGGKAGIKIAVKWTNGRPGTAGPTS